MNFNPLNSKSDQHLTSLYNMYPESHIMVIRMNKMVTRKGTFWWANKFSLSPALEMYKEQCGKYRAWIFLNFFFSDSLLDPKFFKVVANSNKVGRHFQRRTKPFFYAVIVLETKLGKRSLTCYKLDTRMDDMKRSSSPKSKMASSYRSRCTCCGNKLNEEVCCGFIFANLFNSLYL